MLITRRQAGAAVAAALTLGSRRGRAEVVELNVHLKPHTGDFDTILKLGLLRVLVPYSRTFFFENKGRFEGASAYLADEFEKYVRKTHPDSNKKFVVALIPTSRDRLFPDLLAGEGDVAIGDITITLDR